MHKFNIKKAQYKYDYKILLSFDDGVEGVADLKDFLNGNCGVFARLRDREQFKNFKLDSHTIVWGDDLDLAPEFLHEMVLKS